MAETVSRLVGKVNKLQNRRRSHDFYPRSENWNNDNNLRHNSSRKLTKISTIEMVSGAIIGKETAQQVV